MPKTSGFRLVFDKQHRKRAQTLLKSKRQPLYPIYWSLRRKLRWKKCLLDVSYILRLFVNTLTANGKYSNLNRDNLTKPIQTLLSEKQKGFSQSFSHKFEI